MGYLQLAFCVCFLVAQAYGHPQVDSHLQGKVKQVLDKLFTPEYIPNIRPYGVNETSATLVSLYFRNLRIVDLDEVNGRLTFQTYFRQSWVDPRLTYDDSDIRYIPIRDGKSQTLWYPDLFFENAVDGPLTTSKPIRVTKVYPNGKVFHSVRLTQTLICPALLNLENKEVTCTTDVGSYGYLSNDVQVAFTEGGKGFDLGDTLLHPRYTLAEVTTSPTCALASRKAKGHGDEPTPAYSCLSLNFRLTRS